MTDDTARTLVLEELKRLRKRSGAVTVDALSLAPTIGAVLGGGDPYLAFTRLQQHLLDESHERTIKAAAASLGFSSDADTHLDRLTEAGVMLSVDQRQARRLSDEGLESLATLITTNWTIEAVPELVVDVIAERDGLALALSAHHPATVAMREPTVELLSAQTRTTLPMSWSVTESVEQMQLRAGMPVRVTYDALETSLTVVWRGEVWPKFTVRLHGGASPLSVETLGNRLMMRLWSAA
ncbi:hypothetical protein [Paramicrobacterium agarici]|uniref:hypothetical protein n=1 Tax=Paramicrobacterium agarici TaxID=630514 RepID=UPI0011512680|nr:hypothetical protein [Microbacterium agarici]TQO21470.1 hypothetical protein FB385_0272 [Microbacterium agarici]